MIKQTTAVLLASGFSKRMGKNKLFLTYKGKSFLTRALELLTSLPFLEVLVIIQKKDALKMDDFKQVKVIYNTHPERGQSESVLLALEKAKGQHCLFMPVDQPFLTTSLLVKLMEKAQKDNIVYPLYQNKPTTPIFFGHDFLNELKTLSGDNGGRQVRNHHPNESEALSLFNDKELIDIDTPEKYNIWCKKE